MRTIERDGRTEEEKIVNEFARKADLPLDDAMRYLSTNDKSGIDPDKLADFRQSIRDSAYGELNGLRISLHMYKAAGIKVPEPEEP